jgi:hypothetical protein
MAIFVHSEKDGACLSATNNHLWSHRSWLSFTTSTPAANGGNIRVRDYTLQAGVGGPSACDHAQIMAIGTAAHETGHAFGLPDLYSSIGEGIGEWGLMGSGNYRLPSTPAYMSAWSRLQLGWVTPVMLGADTTVTLLPVETGDTVVVIPVPSTSEYFLIENRQRLGSDIGLHGPGLAIWHVDSTLIRQRWSSNNVNEFLPYGLALEQADGSNHLQLTSGGNRGDAGDPFPGSSDRVRWSYNTTPSSARNDGTQTWITIDSITQVAVDGPVRFRLQFGVPTFITTSVPGPSFTLDEMPYTSFTAPLVAGQQYALSMDSLQESGGTRWLWASWSNGQARSHTFTSAAGGDTIQANVTTQHRLQVSVTGSGSVTPSVEGDLVAGAFYDAGVTVTLTAVPQDGHVFDRWLLPLGAFDVASVRPVTMSTPVSLGAVFLPALSAQDVTRDRTIGTPFLDSLVVSGGNDTYTFAVVSGSLPEGVTLQGGGRIGGTPSAPGTTSATISITSGSQSLTRTVSYVVSIPAMDLDAVVASVLGGPTLEIEQRNALDMLGNQNGRVDVGDFLAWVQATGATPTATQMAAIQRAGGAR